MLFVYTEWSLLLSNCKWYSWVLRVLIVKKGENNPATWLCKGAHEFSIHGSLDSVCEIKRAYRSMVKDTVKTTQIVLAP